MTDLVSLLADPTDLIPGPLLSCNWVHGGGLFFLVAGVMRRVLSGGGERAGGEGRGGEGGKC